MKSKSKWTIACMAALSAAGVTGCGEAPRGDNKVAGDWGDERLYPDLGGAYASLTALDGTCTWTAASGTMTIDANDTAQTIIIGKRTVDSAILVNGATCGSPIATSATLKKLNLNAGMGDDQVVILDFINGIFGAGTATARGITVDLGAGTDDLRIRGTSGADTISFGADGVSTATDKNRDIELAGVENYSISLAGGADVFSGAGGVNGVTGAFTDPVTVFGGAANDTITGGEGDDTLNGGDGADTLSGGLGADTINGDAGADTVASGTEIDGDDVIACGADADVVSYASRTNAVTVSIDDALTDDGEAGEADDVQADCEGVTGGPGDDTLTGDGNANTLSGGAGADTLLGGAGADVLNGDAGDDTFDEEDASNGGDTFNGGAGTDTVDYSARTAALTVTMDGTTATDGESGENDNVKADVENLVGGTVNDNITGNALANTITGGAGDDTLSGGAGDDTFAEEDDDSGSDQFNGGAGVDTVDYSARADAVVVTMDGTTADDGKAGEADDVESDVENVLGGDGDDDITGNASNNELSGGAGADTLSGGAGDDTLDGGAGDNDLTCGAGDDIAYNNGGGTRAADCEI